MGTHTVGVGCLYDCGVISRVIICGPSHLIRRHFISSETFSQAPSQRVWVIHANWEGERRRGQGNLMVPDLHFIQYPCFRLLSALTGVKFTASLTQCLWRVDLPSVEMRVGKLFCWVGEGRDSREVSSSCGGPSPSLPVCGATCTPVFQHTCISSSWVFPEFQVRLLLF